MSTPPTEPARPESEPSSEVQVALREFWEGLTTSTRGTFIAALVFCLAEFGVLCLVITPRNFAKLRPALFMETTLDDYAEVSIKLLKYRFSDPERFQIVYLGSSQATRALPMVRNNAIPMIVAGRQITESFSAALGERIDFHRFSTDRQRLRHAIMIADQLPETFNGVMVMVVSSMTDQRVTVEDDVPPRQRIAVVDTPSLDEIDPQGATRGTGNFFYDHLPFFAARRIAAVRLRAAPVAHPVVVHGGNQARAQRALGREQNKFGTPAIVSTRLADFAHLVAVLKKRGVPLIAVEAPKNPLREEFHMEREEVYSLAMEAAAADLGFTYIDFNQELDLHQSDFHDHVHVASKGGRQRFAHALVRHVSRIILDDESGDDARDSGRERPSDAGERDEGDQEAEAP
jgi:hypothetical protein